MAQIWKEPYRLDKALSLGIRTVEDVPVVGEPDARWIYYVSVCSFTFAFFSLDMIERHLAHYSRKILPSSAVPACGWMEGEPQTTFDRLPLYLRSESKRLRVVKALTRALDQFRKAEQPAV